MDDTSRGWGLSLGHQRGPHMATSGDFVTAVDVGAGFPVRALMPTRRITNGWSGSARTAKRTPS